MGKIEDVIRSFGGHQYKICYKDLCCVIAVEKDHQPNPPKMKVIVVEASQRARNRSPRSLWRSVARAVEDLWESGDLDALIAYQRCWQRYRPKPQEFVEVVAWRIWDEEMRNA